MTKACSPRNAARRIHRSVPKNTMPDSSRERQLSLRRDLHDLSHRRHVRNPYYFILVPGMVTSLSECDGYPWHFRPLPVDGIPMSNAQFMDDPRLPADIDDSRVVAH